MNRWDTDVRELRGDEVNLTEEAKRVQSRALRGEISIVRLGEIIFFSGPGGDAWMLDPADGAAACLASAFETLPVPIQETDSKFSVRWSAGFEIEGQEFIVFESDGSIRTFFDYPTAEIERFINEYSSDASQGNADLAGATARLKTGRNDPCPCGSGKKYKKCCLAADEAIVRQVGEAREAEAAESVDLDTRRRHEINGTTPAENRLFSEQKRAEGIDLGPGETSEADKLWHDFEALERPTSEQMNLFLEKFLTLPPGETDWCDLFHAFADRDHNDLPSVFRRMADAIPHTSEEGISFFYWAAAEEFDRRGYRNLLPEAAAGFRKLDGETCDPDALSHLEDYLLAAGYDAETLELDEHFLPIMRNNDDLMPYVVLEVCPQIFELRVGAELGAKVDETRSVESVSQSLRRGIEEEIREEVAADAAAIIIGQTLPEPWTCADFDLVTGNIRADDRAWRDSLRLNRTLMRAAREAWQIDQVPPGCAFTGLTLMLDSVYASQSKSAKRRKTSLLSYLSPSGIEKRLVTSCRGLIGINVPKARRLLQAHDILCRLAARYQLISGMEADRSKEELSRLHNQLNEMAGQGR
jgi:SEC-C motif